VDDLSIFRALTSRFPGISGGSAVIWQAGRDVCLRQGQSTLPHNRRCSRQGETLPNVMHSFDARAMCAHEIRHFEFFHLVGSPVQLLIRRREKVQSPMTAATGSLGNSLSEQF